MSTDAPSPDYRSGYLDAGGQILASLDRCAGPANNAAPIGTLPIGVEHLLVMIANEHPDSAVSPLPAAVREIAGKLVKIRESHALALATVEITAALTPPVSPVEGTDDGLPAARLHLHDDGLCISIGMGLAGDTLLFLSGKASAYDGFPDSDRDRLAAWVEHVQPLLAAPVVGSDDEPAACTCQQLAERVNDAMLRGDSIGTMPECPQHPLSDLPIVERPSIDVGALRWTTPIVDDEPAAWLIHCPPDPGSAATVDRREADEALSEGYRVDALYSRPSPPAPVGQTVTDAMAEATARSAWPDLWDIVKSDADRGGLIAAGRQVLGVALAAAPTPDADRFAVRYWLHQLARASRQFASPDDGALVRRLVGHAREDLEERAEIRAAAPAPGLPEGLVERLAAAAPEGYSTVGALGWVLDERDAMRVPVPDDAPPATTPEDPIARLEAWITAAGGRRVSIDPPTSDPLDLWQVSLIDDFSRILVTGEGLSLGTALGSAVLPASPEPKGGASC